MPDVLYIGGASRSGTTLLERILGLLPDLQTMGEVRHLWSRGVLANELCGCGVPFHACPFWTAVGSNAFGGWSECQAQRMVEVQDRYDRSRRVPGLIKGLRRDRVRSEVKEYAGTYGAMYSAAAQVSGRRVLIDSSKHVSQPFALQADPSIIVRVVHLVRDPRGVAYSWSKELVRPEVTRESRLMDQLSARHVAFDWDVQNALFDLLPMVGVPRLILGYEEFLRDPAAVVGRISDFVGSSLPSDVSAALTRGRVELPPQHSAAGNPMRFKSGAIELRRDDAWRDKLSTRDRRTVELATAPLRLRYRSQFTRPSGGQA